MIKELSRRCDIGESGGGPFSITAVVADMLIDEDGEKKYLTCCWVSEAPEDLSFEVSTKELYPFYLDLDYEDDELTGDDAKASVTETYLSAEGEYTGKYKTSYRVLEKLVMDKVKEEDLLWDDEDDEEDEE